VSCPPLSQARTIEVCLPSKCMPGYTNRQLITLLTDVGGIDNEVFVSMQARVRTETTTKRT
jgi:hypothetical protein